MKEHHLFGLSKRRLGGDLITVYAYFRGKKILGTKGLFQKKKHIKGQCLWTEATKAQIRIIYAFITRSLINHRNKILKEAMVSSSFDVFRSRLYVFIEDMLKANRSYWAQHRGNRLKFNELHCTGLHIWSNASFWPLNCASYDSMKAISPMICGGFGEFQL